MMNFKSVMAVYKTMDKHALRGNCRVYTEDERGLFIKITNWVGNISIASEWLGVPYKTLYHWTKTVPKIKG